MPGMKRDCGGAAGILGSFYFMVKQVSCFVFKEKSVFISILMIIGDNTKSVFIFLIFYYRDLLRICLQYFVWQRMQ